LYAYQHNEWICGFFSIAIMYSITNRASFDGAKEILALAEEQLPGKRLNIVLVGNKRDLMEHREVSFGEGANLARAHEIAFVETSAKNKENLEWVEYVMWNWCRRHVAKNKQKCELQ
jgi:GTPase SAR1 family protein